MERTEIEPSYYPARPMPGVLYHYTTYGGLQGILENREMWCTHMRFMNDFHEMVEGFARLGESCTSELMGIDGRLQSLHQAIRNRGQANIFSTSFSEWPDQLSQWRGYSKPSGIAIGFRTDYLSALADEQNMQIKPCIYDLNGKLKEASNFLRDRLRYSSQNDAVEQLPPPENTPDNDPKIHCTMLVQEFAPVAATFKNDAFYEEHEWRILSKHHQPMSTAVSFRQSSFGLSPFIRLKLGETQRLSQGIAEIRVGPGGTTWPDSPVNLLLEALGMNHVRVTQSDIPYRSTSW